MTFKSSTFSRICARIPPGPPFLSKQIYRFLLFFLATGDNPMSEAGAKTLDIEVN
jgi:hypothetical protein